jgi:molybdopterin/thiamine biosynthesis adenylyltransferase
LSGDVEDRQRRVPGFSQEALDGLTVAVIGAGGLGGVFVRGAVQKGIETLVIYDGDTVEWSNLNRQFFTPRDIGRNKAIRLAHNASRAGYMGTRLVAVPWFFQAAVERGLDMPCDIAFCGVDNDETRVFVARHYLGQPIVFAAVGRDAGHGYVAVQEPGKACFACFRPQALEPKTAVAKQDGECPVDPAVIDVVGVVSMLALYAVDSLVMDRPRRWNFKHIALHGMFPEVNAVVKKRKGCRICDPVGTSMKGIANPEDVSAVLGDVALQKP